MAIPSFGSQAKKILELFLTHFFLSQFTSSPTSSSFKNNPGPGYFSDLWSKFSASFLIHLFVSAFALSQPIFSTASRGILLKYKVRSYHPCLHHYDGSFSLRVKAQILTKAQDMLLKLPSFFSALDSWHSPFLLVLGMITSSLHRTEGGTHLSWIFMMAKNAFFLRHPHASLIHFFQVFVQILVGLSWLPALRNLCTFPQFIYVNITFPLPLSYHPFYT